VFSSGTSGPEEEEDGAVRSFLVFLSGTEWCAADLANIRRVLRPASIARVSGAAPEVLGLMNYQGEVLCVLDLQRILGAGSCGELQDVDGKFVMVMHYGGREAGFLVDSVEDVWELPGSSVLPVLESLEPSRARLFEGTVTSGGRFAGLLSPSMCLNP
jgi:chemotaxis signal transduction protein